VQPEQVEKIRNSLFEWDTAIHAYYRMSTFEDQFDQSKTALRLNSARDLLNEVTPEKINEV